jgi:hypothetical protein
MCIISSIGQPDVIKKILQHLGLWEESQAPPERDHLRSILQPAKLKTSYPVVGRHPVLPASQGKVDITLSYPIQSEQK